MASGERDADTNRALFDICRAFLAAGTVEDLVEIAPRVIGGSLGMPATCQVVLVDPVSLRASPPRLAGCNRSAFR